MFEFILAGFANCLTPINLLISAGGLFIGIIFGALPGFSATMAVSVFVPFSFWFPPATALLLLSGLFCGAIYGGSITAVLLGIPGTPASVPTTFDGVKMVKRGEAGRALGIVTYASAAGGFLSSIALMFGAPMLAMVAMKVGPPEQFALTVFGLSVVCILTSGNMLRGLLVGVFSLILGCVGQDPIHAYPRFTFGNFEIITGLPLIPILIGAFCLPEVFKMLEEGVKKKSVVDAKINRLFITLKDLKATFTNCIRSALIGIGIGIIPAAGPDIAAFISYNQAANSSKDPASFGKGNPQGIVAAEAANNGATGGSLIPLLTLGIPGSAPAALYLGALYIHGLRPGGQLFTVNAPIVYTLLAGFCVINILMYFIGLLFCRISARVVTVSRMVLAPCIIILTVVGAYANQRSLLDVWIMFIAGVIAFILGKYDFPVSPIALGLILGPLMEQTFGQSMIMFRSNAWLFATRPLALLFFAMAAFSLMWPTISKKFMKKRKQKQAPSG
ncbi:MAG: tripartite tricarboxylate transporter permease [Clostridia bacterium]|nr:tripartite tricarboxylate transporter permease [Clostridia bacterium]